MPEAYQGRNEGEVVAGYMITSVSLRGVYFFPCHFSCHLAGLSLRGHEQISSHGTGRLCIDFTVDMKCLCSL